MTREEAIQVLNSYDGYFIGYRTDDVDEALDMAIKALEQQPITWIVGKDNCQVAVRNMPIDKMQKICAIIGEEEQQPKTIQEKQAESEKYQKAFDDGYENGYAQARFDYGQEPSEDCVSREDALNGLVATDLKGWQLAVALEAIENLSPVIPARPSGNWVETSLTPISGGDFNRGYKCSCCDYAIVVDDFNYCPNCGAKMEVGNDL